MIFIFQDRLTVDIADQTLVVELSAIALTEYFCYYINPKTRKEFKFGLRKIRGEWIVRPVLTTLSIPTKVIWACIDRLEIHFEKVRPIR